MLDVLNIFFHEFVDVNCIEAHDGWNRETRDQARSCELIFPVMLSFIESTRLCLQVPQCSFRSL